MKVSAKHSAFGRLCWAALKMRGRCRGVGWLLSRIPTLYPRGGQAGRCRPSHHPLFIYYGHVLPNDLAAAGCGNTAYSRDLFMSMFDFLGATSQTTDEPVP